MGFHDGAPLSWSRLERILSGRKGLAPVPADHLGGAPPARYRQAGPPFAELHAKSSYSFLGGASDPEALVDRAVELGLHALALVDRDGFYGAVKFAEAAAARDLPTVFGAELTLGDRVLTVLCRDPEGYRRLSRLISQAQLAGGEKGKVSYPPLELIAAAAGGHWIALADHGWAEEIDQLVELFGMANVVREYQVTMTPEDADHHARLDRWNNLRAIVSARPAAATRHDAPLARAKQSLARRETMHRAEAELHPMGAHWLRSGAQIATMLGGRRELLAAAVEIAGECAFTLDLVAPKLPRWRTPEGHTEMSWLRHTVTERARVRYASRPVEIREKALAQVNRELGVIDDLDFPGYFLIVMDLVDFCREQNILCQGRGSAANSVVCFALGITNVEPISAGLLFERFLSPDREGPPDIDIDIESGRREEVIQHVYNKYGRDNAAQVANVITYRIRGAIRDVARALGYPQGAADAWGKGTAEPPEPVLELAGKLRGQPRHLGIHSGGMVICDRPIADVVPIEWARMAGRSVVQWDKDDCASAGLVKFDLLGLGMLEALHHMLDLVQVHQGRKLKLWELDLGEEGVYEMLSRADAVGVFQVESRAQLATLPRLKPRNFFDLVVEVALIRPGPIQGGSVHPYLRRRNGEEPVTYAHPVLVPALAKTLGIPLFQEQLMQVAVDAAGFSGAEADNLRRAMGSKRSPVKMAAIRERFYRGLAQTSDIHGEVADRLWQQIVAFAAYGFPESHSQSFASLVYFSAWFKYHYPAEFCVGLLRAQPMGFYSPQSLIADARRHGITIQPIDVNVSGAESDCEDGGIRLGLNLVQGLGAGAGERIAAAAPFAGIADLSRRADLSVAQVESLARAGALESFGMGRRQALWEAGIAATEKESMLPGMSAIQAPPLPGMNAFELLVADIASTGVSHQMQPMALIRETLHTAGILRADQLSGIADGSRVRIAGVVTHRQRPRTASGATFLGLEDETGLMNVMVSPGLWKRQRLLARTAKALVIRGIVQNSSGAVSVVADRLEPLAVAELLSRGSRDFR